jgi:hypothetical protein
VGVLRAVSGLVVVDLTAAASAEIKRVARSLRETPPVFYLHDAATVLFPFTFEPVATLVEQHDEKAQGPFPFRDLGLPPLGASARRFGDPSLGDEPILKLSEIPDAALVRYVSRALESAVAVEPP